MVAAILWRGWAARLLVSPHIAPPGLKNPTTGLSPQEEKPWEFDVGTQLTPTRHRACRPTTGIPPQVCFLQLPGRFIAAAQVPCATTAHEVTVLVCVGSVTISPSGNPALSMCVAISPNRNLLY